jgi:hypothetical protein
VPKPAWSAFRQVADTGGGAAGPCGDFDPPAVRIISPVPGTKFVDKLDIQATATDAGVGLGRITFAYDSGATIRNFGDLSNDRPVGMAPWYGSAQLSIGRHTITVIAVDKNGNVGTASVVVEKVKTLASTLVPKLKLARGGKVNCKGGVCSYGGRLVGAGAGSASIGGHVAVEWQLRNAQGKWRKLSGGLKSAHKPFTFTAKLRQAGKWRVRVVYQGQAPWKKVASPFTSFTVR